MKARRGDILDLERLSVVGGARADLTISRVLQGRRGRRERGEVSFPTQARSYSSSESRARAV
jgi:hypothetical protein